METDYLRALYSLLGRTAFSPEVLLKLVAPAGEGKKQISAYNLCDGKHTQAEIASRVSLDQGSLSRSISRWIDAGIVARIGELPVHVYPLAAADVSKRPRKKDAHR